MRRPHLRDALSPAQRGRLARGSALVALLAAGGCGSASVAELPPAAKPDRSPAPEGPLEGEVRATSTESAREAAAPRRTDLIRSGTLRVALDPRARTLRLEDARSGASIDEIPVGVGPTQVACASRGPCFVTDTTGDALLVVRIGSDGRTMRLVRRVYVAGAPYAIAVDRERRRTWVTLTGRSELVEFGAHGRPHILRRRPVVRQPDGVRVDPATGDVTVTGLVPPQVQVLPDPATPDRS